MGVFTVLGEPELAAVAKDFGLDEVTRFASIAAGTINSNFELETARGHYFVRVNEGKAEPDVAWEARTVEALAQRGVVTPAPLVAQDGRPYAPLPGHRKWISVFPWRPGHHLSPVDVTPEYAGRLGEALAQLHVAGLELPTSWWRGSIYDHAHLLTRFERFARSDDPALAHATAILREELAEGTRTLALRAAATRGLIHGDLFRDNVLWQGDELTAILDFEQASAGSLVYDLAVCINDWCWIDRPAIDLAAALVAGYQRVRPLTAGDRAALPIELRCAAARFTITRITDVYLARVRNPEKDFRAFLARCEAWRGQALGQVMATV